MMKIGSHFFKYLFSFLLLLTINISFLLDAIEGNQQFLIDDIL